MINNPVRKQLPTLENPGTAIDLRSGKSLIAQDGSVVTGTLPEVEQATPAISVSSGGLITATAVQVGGIVADGTKSAIQQLPTQGAATITPGTTAKTAIAKGRYTTGDVKVAGDANLVPENIAEGVSIFGVTGTHSGGTKAICTVSIIGWDYMYDAFVSTGSEIINLKDYKGQSIEIVVPTVLAIRGDSYDYFASGNYTELIKVIYNASTGYYLAVLSITGDVTIA
jgi:hypothetical protein